MTQFSFSSLTSATISVIAITKRIKSGKKEKEEEICMLKESTTA